jgi:hypothetical protein
MKIVRVYPLRCRNEYKEVDFIISRIRGEPELSIRNNRKFFLHPVSTRNIEFVLQKRPVDCVSRIFSKRRRFLIFNLSSELSLTKHPKYFVPSIFQVQCARLR